MGLALALREPRRQRLRSDPDRDHGRGGAGRAAAGFDQDELRLPGADQLKIDLGQDLGVEQRAMLGAA